MTYYQEHRKAHARQWAIEKARTEVVEKAIKWRAAKGEHWLSRSVAALERAIDKLEAAEKMP
jgi:hypothetical protein